MNTVKTRSQKRTSQRNKIYQHTTEFKAVRFVKKAVEAGGRQSAGRQSAGRQSAGRQSAGQSDVVVEFDLSNGSTVTFPAEAFKNLAKATQEQMQNYELTPYFIFWDDVDEIVGIKNLFDGSISL